MQLLINGTTVEVDLAGMTAADVTAQYAGNVAAGHVVAANNNLVLKLNGVAMAPGDLVPGDAESLELVVSP